MGEERGSVKLTEKDPCAKIQGAELNVGVLITNKGPAEITVDEPSAELLAPGGCRVIGGGENVVVRLLIKKDAKKKSAKNVADVEWTHSGRSGFTLWENRQKVKGGVGKCDLTVTNYDAATVLLTLVNDVLITELKGGQTYALPNQQHDVMVKLKEPGGIFSHTYIELSL